MSEHKNVISDEAVEAAADAMAPVVKKLEALILARAALEAAEEYLSLLMADPNGDYTMEARDLLEAAAPHIIAALVADLDTWAGRSKPGYYDEAQDDVVQIPNPYRSQA